MVTKRSSTTRPAPAPEPEAPALGDLGAPAIEPEPDDDAIIDPFVIGPASAPMTPGWLMGISSRPETPAEHAIRLGAAAGKFNDAGFILGTLAPRPEWPAPGLIPLAAEAKPA